MRILLVALPLAGLLYWGGPRVETLALWLASGLMAVSLLAHLIPPLHKWRDVFSDCAATLLSATLTVLFAHLLNDDFGYRAVWLYSGAELVWWLKFSALWAGEEGTLMLLAACAACAAAGLRAGGNWVRSSMEAIALTFAIGTLIWPPFTAAPAEAAQLPLGRGLNAHLDTFWMALHPPLVLLAYAVLLIPVGAALQSLARGDGPLRAQSESWLRLGWLLLTLGLATGMAWSFEDATFGQLWHWDPVQTAVFATWALATAALHGLRIYHPNVACARSFPLLVLACAASVPVAMAVTRSQTLASSHRYIGDTAQPLFLLLSGMLVAAALGAWWQGRARLTRRVGGGALWLRFAAMLIFASFAGLALLALLDASIAAWRSLPRPDATQPFYDTVLRWGDSTVLKRFAQWEVDPYAMNRWLAPPAALLALLGGHAFLDVLPKSVARGLSATAVLTGAAVAIWLSPLENLYTGTGMTSLQTQENFLWLELLYVGLLWLVLCAGLRGFLALRSRDSHMAGVALLHAGAALALGSLLAATVLDSYAQRRLDYPSDFQQKQQFADGYAVELSLASTQMRSDGARGAGFVAQISAELSLPNDVQLLGVTRLREAQPPAPGDSGAARQQCEILDYRYARAVGGATRRMDPLIERGLWRDVQLWVPSPNYVVDENGLPQAQAGALTVVIKSFPLLGWLWIGLALLCLAATWLSLRAQLFVFRRRREKH